MTDTEWRELERAARPQATPAVPEPTGSLWLSPHGRISRSTYWLKFVLPLTGLNLAATVVDWAVLGVTEAWAPVSLVTSLVLLWPSIVGFVKRLHDLDLSGWIIPGLYGASILGAIVTAVAVATVGEIGLILALPLVVVAFMSLWYTFKVMFVAGTPGPNTYGPDPRS